MEKETKEVLEDLWLKLIDIKRMMNMCQKGINHENDETIAEIISVMRISGSLLDAIIEQINQIIEGCLPAGWRLH